MASAICKMPSCRYGRDNSHQQWGDLGRKTSHIAVGSDGAESPLQFGADGKARFRGELPSVGHGVFHLRRGKTDCLDIRASEKGMGNDVVRIRSDKAGRLRSVLDKRVGREVIAAGETGSRFLLFEDKPIFWNAWDIDIYNQDKIVETDGRLLSAKVVETGPVGSVVRFERQISRSTIIQDVVLHADSPRIDFASCAPTKPTAAAAAGRSERPCR